MQVRLYTTVAPIKTGNEVGECIAWVSNQPVQRVGSSEQSRQLITDSGGSMELVLIHPVLWRFFCLAAIYYKLSTQLAHGLGTF